MSETTRGSRGRILWPAILVVAVLAAGGLGTAWLRAGGDGASHGPVTEVRRGNLTISVTESGTLRHRDQRIVSNEVEGRTTILWIIDEGTEVEEGDLLVELDSSDLEDRLVEREISVQNARAAFIRAEQDLAVTHSRTESEIEEQALRYRFAKLDLAKYTGVDELAEGDHDLEEIERILARTVRGSAPADDGPEPGQRLADASGEAVDAIRQELAELNGVSDQRAQQIAQRQESAAREGEYAQELERLRSEIDLATEELKRAQGRYEDSKSLFDRGFVTQLELEGDRLAMDRARVNLELAQGRLRLYESYTHRRQLEQLESDVRQAYAALQRTKMRAEADIVQAQANFDARQQELERQERQLERLKEQIEKCRIYAPVAGTVVYETSANPGRWGNREPLEAGQDVRERQELIYLPASEGMIAEVQIHESVLNRIEVGMPARVEVESRPGEVFRGYVRRIAPMPDATSRWMNPDLITYSTQIAIDTSQGLRTGTRARTQIIVDELEDVLYVPVQAVVRRGREHYAYVVGPDGPQPRPVEIGMDNMRHVHIKDGLREGERVLLAPPLYPGEGARPDREDETDAEEAPAAEPAEVGADEQPQRQGVPRGEGGGQRGGGGGGRGGGGAGGGGGGTN